LNSSIGCRDAKKIVGDFITVLEKLMTCYVGNVSGGIGTLLT